MWGLRWEAGRKQENLPAGRGRGARRFLWFLSLLASLGESSLLLFLMYILKDQCGGRAFLFQTRFDSLSAVKGSALEKGMQARGLSGVGGWI